MQSELSEAFIAFGFSTILSHRDTNPQYRDGTMYDLAMHLSQHTRLIPCTRAAYAEMAKADQARIKDGPAILLGKFQPGYRDLAHLEYVTGLGLDIDEFHVELDTIKLVLGSYAAIIYETANSTPQRRRWRALIPFGRPATVEEYHLAYTHWSQRMPGVAANSDNAAHLWYGTQRFKDSETRIALNHPGMAYDPALKSKPSTREAFKQRITLPVGAPAAEGARNAALNAYATSIVKDCESEGELFIMLSQKNMSYAPPLDIAEVRGISRRKWQKRAMFAWVDVARDPNPPNLMQGSPDEPDTALDLNALLDADHGEVPWVVQDTLTYGAHLLVGRPKGGKSWITMDMSLAVGNGGSFLGAQARKGAVLWIAGEDTAAGLGRRLKVRGERTIGNVTIHTMETLKKERANWEADVTFEAWLRAYLEVRTDIVLVIIDTHKTVEAIWANEQIDTKRHASIVDIAYQSVRLYDEIGQATQTCIVLVHHAGKMKNNVNVDYHERINLPATAVAGATASLVLADPPDRDIHDEDDHRRVFAVRGRHIVKEDPLLIELQGGRATRLDVYRVHAQTQAQAEIFEAVEALLQGAETVTIAQVAQHLGKHRNTVQGALARAGKQPGGMVWKGRKLAIKRNVGLYWEGA